MLKKFVKLTFLNSGVILFFLLLISCKSNALQSFSDSEFSALLSRAEQLKDSDPKAALMLLDAHKNDVNKQPITNQVNYLRIQSSAYSDQALYSLSEAAAEKGLNLTKQMNNPSIFIAELAYTKGYSRENLGDLHSALQFYQNGLDVARSMNNQEMTTRGLINIGAIFYLSKDYKQSLITLNQALQLANELADEALLGDIKSELGILYGYLREQNHANDYLQQSYQHFKKAGKHTYALNSLHNIAINHANIQRYEQAVSVYRLLESEIQPNTSNEFIATLYRDFAWALMNQKVADIENAYRYILLAGEYVKEVEQHFVKLQYFVDKAYVLEKMARFQEALVSLEQAEILLERKDNDLYVASALDILYLKAQLHYALGQFSQAFEMQTQYFTKFLTYQQARETTEIDELRLQFESEAAQRHNDILEKKQRVQSLQLQQMKLEANSRQLLVAVLAICTLVLAWFLFRVIKGQRNLIHVTRTDSLTGVANRRRLLQLGNAYFLTAQEQQQAFSVYMIDIDFFKKINDQFGHSVGDKALKEIAALGQSLMRTSDVFGRCGGEEFIALLPNTDHREAIEVAQRLRENIERANWQTQQIKQLTVSIGVATFRHNNYCDFSALLKAADEQLLKAKQSGRNKVSFDE